MKTVKEDENDWNKEDDIYHFNCQLHEQQKYTENLSESSNSAKFYVKFGDIESGQTSQKKLKSQHLVISLRESKLKNNKHQISPFPQL